MRKFIVIAFVLLILIAFLSGYFFSQTRTNKPESENQEMKTSSRVRTVIDGDTIRIEDGRIIRLLGIDAPELDQLLYYEAKIRLESLILGKEVQLEADFENMDRHNRLLRYVFIDKILVNLQLVKEGFATVIDESGLRYEEQLHDLEDYARTHELGIWKKDVAYADHVYIIKFHYDARGADEENLNDEYVIIGNKNDKAIDMTGWTINDDDSNQIFVFSNFILQPEKSVTIYSGSGINSDISLYWKSIEPIWSNKEDAFFLRNKSGELVLYYEY